MDFFTISLVLCMATLGSSSRMNVPAYPSHSPPSDSSFDVMSYGASGDGETDDSQAFLKAWKAVCGATLNPSTLRIPATKTFLLHPVLFKGPCKSPNINVEVWGKIVAPSKKSAWANHGKRKWIVFTDVEGLTINGNGSIDGQGSDWWQSCILGKNCEKPTALAFEDCDNLKLSGLNHQNSPRNHISISNCSGVILSGLKITAPETSPNTDGIDISHSTNITIQGCKIATGDDCIAINDGCSYINITQVACGPGHGISVGSLGANGARSTVEEVHVKNCTFNGTQNGARIKTWQGGSGYARKISFENIRLSVADHPIIIDQFYCAHEICKNQTSAVEISDVSYSNFHGTSYCEDAIQFKCSQSNGCTNIVVNNVNITSADPGKKTYSSCLNAHGRCTAAVPDVNCLW